MLEINHESQVERGLTLEPMGLGELLDKTFNIFKRDFKKLLPIALVGYIPLFIVFSIIGVLAALMTEPDQESVIFLVVLVLILGLPASVFFLISYGALIRGAAGGVLNEPFTIKQSLKVGLYKSIPLLITGLLVGLTTLIGFIFLIIPGIILSVYLSLFGQVTILENQGFFKAMKRSYNLVSGHFWHVIVVNIVIYLLTNVVTGIITLPLSFIPVIGSLASMVVSMLVFPIQILATTLVYFNLRSIKEGYDLELQAENILASNKGEVPLA